MSREENEIAETGREEADNEGTLGALTGEEVGVIYIRRSEKIFEAFSFCISRKNV